jgi:RNase H-fold protein (predicted Holliday junction resolvase)
MQLPFENILAIDPGSDKCGIAVVAQDGRVLHQAVVSAAEIGGVARQLIVEYAVSKLLLGDRTAARSVRDRLRETRVPLEPVVVDEHRSSEEGRRRYFRDNPRKGWRRLLPVTLQTPPRAYDDYVAVVLAERYLHSQRSG